MMASGQGAFRRTCAICGGTEGDLLYQQRYVREGNASFLEGYDVVACSACGFAFADGIPDQQWFDAYYGMMSKYEDNARSGTETKWEVEKMRAVAQTMIPHVPNHYAQIVDIGCSSGQLLAHFRDAGFEHVLGVDPSPACAQIAMQRFG
ncbi:MAG: class I SAM-dependent methyltransferase, partial [Parachlamydiaceae bacterium]